MSANNSETSIASDKNLQYVRSLFKYILYQEKPSDENVSFWNKRLIELNDPMQLIQEFVSNGHHQQLIALERDGRSPWHSGHFYSPLVSRSEITNKIDSLLSPAKDLPGISINTTLQLELLWSLSKYFDSFPYPDSKEEGFRYYSNIHSYAYGDAIIYWSIINHLKPAQIVEIGCGSSSCLALDSIEILQLNTKCTFIDPDPQVALQMIGELTRPHVVLESKVQDACLDVFSDLNPGDILFIDSTHVLKTGSDVYYELTKVLPNLKPGVWIHFHDIFCNFEYPRQWLEQNFSWNEIYAIQLFLMHNQSYSIKLFPHHLARLHSSQISEIFNDKRQRFMINPGGSLWLQKTK